MAGSFWRDNPCAPGWSNRISSWWHEEPPHLLHTEQYVAPFQPILGFSLIRAKGEHAPQISEFWTRFFVQTSLCKCFVPAEHIQTCILDKSWEVFIVINIQAKEIVGTIVRRWLKKLHIRDTVFERAGMADFFCVHPAFRDKGIGRWLLATLHNTVEPPVPPHLILWEGLQIKVPPAVQNTYWVKKRPVMLPIAASMARKNISCSLITDKKSWLSCVKGCDIWTEDGSFREVSMWKLPAGIVAVWNTFHCSMPDGVALGIIMSGNAIAIDQFLAVGPFGILLSAGCPEGSQGWTRDSSFQFITYNLSTNFMSEKFPCIAL
jgi:hypothetical protein